MSLLKSRVAQKWAAILVLCVVANFAGASLALADCANSGFCEDCCNAECLFQGGVQSCEFNFPWCHYQCEEGQEEEICDCPIDP